jgi:predicted transcriptional regulator
MTQYDVLDHFRSNPDKVFTSTELAIELDMTKAAIGKALCNLKYFGFITAESGITKMLKKYRIRTYEGKMKTVVCPHRCYFYKLNKGKFN